MRLYLDIETIPTQRPDLAEHVAAKVRPPAQMKKAETIEAWEVNERPAAVAHAIAATGLDAALGELWCVGFAWENGPVYVLSRCDHPEPLSAAAEVATLSAFWAQLKTPPGAWVGHNVLGFDLPFLWRRSVVLGLRPPVRIPWDAPPWDRRVVLDTMALWSGIRDRVSLDTLCLALGVRGKGDGLDGSKVWGAVQEGRYEEVRTYCAADVERTRAVLKRLLFEEVPT